MANNKAYQEIEQTSTEELQHELAAEKLRLSKMKFNHAVNPLEDTSIFKQTRKQIARLQTELSKRKLAN